MTANVVYLENYIESNCCMHAYTSSSHSEAFAPSASTFVANLHVLQVLQVTCSTSHASHNKHAVLYERCVNLNRYSRTAIRAAKIADHDWGSR